PDRLISANPLTAMILRHVSTAKCCTNSLANHGTTAMMATATRINGSMLRPVDGGVEVMEDAVISSLALAQNAARAHDEHKDDQYENEHVGRARAEEQAGVAFHQAKREPCHGGPRDAAQAAQD